MIEPSRVFRRKDVPAHCVITFFQDVIGRLKRRGRVVHVTGSEAGKNPLYEIRVRGRRLAFFHPGVGAALAGGFLEEIIAMGCRKFIVVGGAGGLKPGLRKGALIVPTAALRDEGTSYHYLPPSRFVRAHPRAVRAIEATLSTNRIPYIKGKTWTTDGFYRETRRRVRRRLAEGCLTVEMEAAAFFAVAKYRRVVLGQILYRADDLSGPEWDGGGMGHSQKAVRARLFDLAAEACLRL